MRRIKGFALALIAGGALLTVAGTTPAAAQPQAAGSGFQSLSPARVLDTRSGSPVGQGGTVTVTLPDSVPATATAVVLNVTGTQPTTPTFVTVYPTGVTRPTASNLNLVTGETRPNLVTVAVGAGRKVDLYNNGGTVHLIADLAGYYSTAAPAKFTVFNARRFLDTRDYRDGKFNNPLGHGETTTLDLADRVPSSATAVTFNLTGVGATAATFVTAWPAGTTRPEASNLNLVPGAETPNLVTVALGADRKVSLYNNAGSAHLIVDLAGFYSPDLGSLFTPMTPQRVLDTRQSGGPVGDTEITTTLDHLLAFPATGVVLNLTGTQATANTYVHARNRGETWPSGSNLNLAPGQTAANLVVVGLSTGASFNLLNGNGTTHLIADIAGYFALPPSAECVKDCLIAWGNNRNGQLGTGSYNLNTGRPMKVYGLSDVKAVASENSWGYALRSDGTVWAWGLNSGSELGLGYTSGTSVVPVKVPGLTDIVAIDAGLALKADGTVWQWGYYGPSRTGSPVQVAQLTNVTAIADGFGASFALRSDGSVWAWGRNSYGALGIGNPDHNYETRTPVPVPGLTGVRAIKSGYAVKNDGTLWAWGSNEEGQLGNGKSGGYEAAPVQVVGLTDVVSFDGGFAALGNGTAWSWGSNLYGRLGTGQTCDACFTSTPTQISGLTGVRSVSSSLYGGYALGTDGKLWAWGSNSDGQLGTEALEESRVPVPVAAPTGVSQISGGLYAGFALVP